jgi:Tol biopolymer transport system component
MSARPVGGLLAALAATAVVVGLCAAPPARATFDPIQLISKSALEQAGEAGEPAISADGHYVAFCAELGGNVGVFRERLGTGELVPVVFFSAGVGCPQAASGPAISADGRYVSFTIGQGLTAEDADEARDVYVADMDTSPPTYRLASAVEGSEEPLPGGSMAAGRDAISADGNRVAFVNQGNVYVRELSTERTILISARREADGAMTSEPVHGGGAYEPAGASISADGSTVAWVGEHLPEQVPLVSYEKAAIERIETSAEIGLQDQYHEPLWRRVPPLGETAPPTRRIVGGGDPLAPGCPPTGTLEVAACRGPYPSLASSPSEPQISELNGFGWGVKLPQLDADGDEVAVAGDPNEQYDLFVVDMGEGLDRNQAVRKVTQWTSPIPLVNGKTVSSVLGEIANYPFTGEISDCAISADGTRVAFTTTRQHFTTAPYALITGIAPAASLIPELYVLNLEGDTIERATPGPGQSVSEPSGPNLLEGANRPSFGGDRLIAFASPADNLVSGDANEGSDVFTIESPPPTPIGQSAISVRPLQAAVPPGWRMTANAYSRPNGEVRLVARVPATGTLRATARAQIGSHLKSRQVATARGHSKSASVVGLELKLGRGRQELAHKPGLVTRISVTFAGHGGKPLHVDLQARFLVHRKRPGKHRKAAGR